MHIRVMAPVAALTPPCHLPTNPHPALIPSSLPGAGTAASWGYTYPREVTNDRIDQQNTMLSAHGVGQEPLLKLLLAVATAKHLM